MNTRTHRADPRAKKHAEINFFFFPNLMPPLSDTAHLSNSKGIIKASSSTSSSTSPPLCSSSSLLHLQINFTLLLLSSHQPLISLSLPPTLRISVRLTPHNWSHALKNTHHLYIKINILSTHTCTQGLITSSPSPTTFFFFFFFFFHVFESSCFWVKRILKGRSS